MSGEQNKLSAAPTRNQTSFARSLEEHVDPAADAGSARENRSTDVDSLVSDFLQELNSVAPRSELSEPARIRPEVTTAAVSTPEPEAATPTYIPAAGKLLSPTESDVAPSDLETTLAATLDELEREQSNVVHLTSRERTSVEGPSRSRAEMPRPEDAPSFESRRADESWKAAAPFPPPQPPAEQIRAVPLPVQDSAATEAPIQSRVERQTVPEPISEQPPSDPEAAAVSPPITPKEVAPEQNEPATRETGGSPGTGDTSRVTAQPVLPAEASQVPNQISAETQVAQAPQTHPVKSVATDAPKAQAEPEHILRGIYEEHRHRRQMLFIQLIVIVVILTAGLIFGYFYVKSKSKRAGSTPTRASATSPSGQTAQPGENALASLPLSESPASGADGLTNSTTSSQAAGGSATLGEIPAEPVKKVLPPYPMAAKGQKIFGKVELDVDVQVDEKGNVVRASAVNGPALFRADAEKALMKWLFKPASREGVPVPSTVRIPVAFNPQ